jgi:hypothetical protein
MDDRILLLENMIADIHTNYLDAWEAIDDKLKQVIKIGSQAQVMV